MYQLLQDRINIIDMLDPLIMIGTFIHAASSEDSDRRAVLIHSSSPPGPGSKLKKKCWSQHILLWMYQLLQDWIHILDMLDPLIMIGTLHRNRNPLLWNHSDLGHGVDCGLHSGHFGHHKNQLHRDLAWKFRIIEAKHGWYSQHLPPQCIRDQADVYTWNWRQAAFLDFSYSFCFLRHHSGGTNIDLPHHSFKVFEVVQWKCSLPKIRKGWFGGWLWWQRWETQQKQQFAYMASNACRCVLWRKSDVKLLCPRDEQRLQPVIQKVWHRLGILLHAVRWVRTLDSRPSIMGDLETRSWGVIDIDIVWASLLFKHGAHHQWSLWHSQRCDVCIPLLGVGKQCSADHGLGEPFVFDRAACLPDWLWWGRSCGTGGKPFVWPSNDHKTERWKLPTSFTEDGDVGICGIHHLQANDSNKKEVAFTRKCPPSGFCRGLPSLRRRLHACHHHEPVPSLCANRLGVAFVWTDSCDRRSIDRIKAAQIPTGETAAAATTPVQGGTWRISSFSSSFHVVCWLCSLLDEDSACT